jgi:hypothetical protein
LKRAESKDYSLPLTSPPFLNDGAFQVAWFLAKIMRSTSENLTGKKLLKRAKSICWMMMKKS